MRYVAAVLAITVLVGGAGHSSATVAGQFDPAFGGGVVDTHFADTFADVRAVVVQPDGKVVAAGRFAGVENLVFHLPSPFRSTIALARYDTDGRLDATFGIGGIVITDLPGSIYGSIEYVAGLALQPDGKLVAAGAIEIGTPLEHMVVLRYLADGTLDPAFGSGGVADGGVLWASYLRRANGVAIQPDGRIVVAGNALARFLPDGVLDSSFGIGGLVTFSSGETLQALTLQADGRIVVAGTDGDDILVARYDADGLADASFGTGGRTLVDLGSSDDVGAGLALQPDGKLVAVGWRVSDWAVVRLDTAGALDPTFGTGGTLVVSLDSYYDQLAAVAVQADGKIVVAGYASLPTSERTPTLARLLPDGTFDPGFGTAGVVVSSFRRGRDFWHAVALAPDGKLVVGGGEYSFVVARVLGGTCGDGVSEGGEECDDGNLVSGDGCSAGCCLADTDGDGRCNSLDPCQGPSPPSSTAYAKKLVVTHLDTLPVLPFSNPNFLGDEVFSLAVELVVPTPFSPALDPVANGLRFTVDDALGGTPMDVTIPGGTYSSLTKVGWKALPVGSPTPTRWTYVDKRPHPLHAITGASVQDKSARVPGLVKVKAKGKRGYYTPLVDHLPLSATVVLSPPLATAQCALASFPGPALAGECTLVGTRLTCK